MTVKLLTEHHLEFLSSKVGCTSSFKSRFVKMLHCWKSHVAAHIRFLQTILSGQSVIQYHFTRNTGILKGWFLLFLEENRVMDDYLTR